MKRRDFMLAFGAASLAPLTAQAAGTAYRTGLVQEKLAAGETIFLDFKAEWCTTCRAQERVIDALKRFHFTMRRTASLFAFDRRERQRISNSRLSGNALKDENPAYVENITFIDVDWDEFGRSEIVDRYNVPRRSTLIALKGDREIGRIVAGTSRQDIQTLMDGALNPATS